MPAYEFRGNEYYEYKGWWFVWEPAWESYRPIDGIVWDGDSFVFEDREYCSDILDPLYGYGSNEMKELCELLSDRHSEYAKPVEMLPVKSDTLTWFFDRRVPVSPCQKGNLQSWKKLVQGKHRTLRKTPRGSKFTRRQSRKV